MICSMTNREDSCKLDEFVRAITKKRNYRKTAVDGVCNVREGGQK